MSAIGLEPHLIATAIIWWKDPKILHLVYLDPLLKASVPHPLPNQVLNEAMTNRRLNWKCIKNSYSVAKDIGTQKKTTIINVDLQACIASILLWGKFSEFKNESA